MFWNRKVKSECKAVLITGCDSGFGNRLAIRLNELGYRVFATVLDPNYIGSQELTQKCKNKDNMIIVQMDVTKDQDIDMCFKIVKNDLNTSGHQLWAVVNNAGRLTYGPTSWGTFEDIQKEFDVNTLGVVRVTRKFTPLIVTSQGRIVIVASMAGRIALDNFGAYCMTKYALVGYADVLRREMNKFNVKVSTIEPGLFKTNMYFSAEGILERNWNETDESIKELYGEQYYKDLAERLKSVKKLGQANKNLDVVVNDIIDAVVSKSPNKRYCPVNTFLLRPIPLFLPLTPQFVVDMFMNMMQISTKPAAMLNVSNSKM